MGGGIHFLLPFSFSSSIFLSTITFSITADMTEFLTLAVEAAHQAGDLLRKNFGIPLKVSAFEAHDIKLDLDVRSQELITGLILARFPEHAIFGEEGIAGNQESEYQWIVDPIDGTVNYFYSIPHFCISIALRRKDEIIAGVIYDPMRDDLWTADNESVSLLNGAPCRVSERTRLSDAILSVGFSKTKTTIDSGLPLLEKMVYKARKCRLMGSAALDMAYVSSGRLDAYIEQAVSLWDIAAGKLIVEKAGGRVEITEREDMKGKLSVIASSGHIDLSV
jgi:myo-inositol-1(or 4)-monophosphatase